MCKLKSVIIICILCLRCLNTATYSQNLQLHYDMRHTIDPENNSKNYPTLYFQYYKNFDSDSSKYFIKPGAFLLTMQANLLGEKNNIGSSTIQVSQSFRCWEPKVYLNLQYMGGLGITEPREYSYYIQNTYLIGISYPFKWHNAYMTTNLSYKYVPYNKPSHDFLYSLYWWQGLFKYKGEFSGNFSVWTVNKNLGDEYTKGMKGKRFSFIGEPQFWYKLGNKFAVGSKINMYYHIYTYDNVLQVYPTVGIRFEI